MAVQPGSGQFCFGSGPRCVLGSAYRLPPNSNGTGGVLGKYIDPSLIAPAQRALPAGPVSLSGPIAPDLPSDEAAPTAIRCDMSQPADGSRPTASIDIQHWRADGSWSPQLREPLVGIFNGQPMLPFPLPQSFWSRQGRYPGARRRKRKVFALAPAAGFRRDITPRAANRRKKSFHSFRGSHRKRARADSRRPRFTQRRGMYDLTMEIMPTRRMRSMFHPSICPVFEPLLAPARRGVCASDEETGLHKDLLIAATKTSNSRCRRQRLFRAPGLPLPLRTKLS